MFTFGTGQPSQGSDEMMTVAVGPSSTADLSVIFPRLNPYGTACTLVASRSGDSMSFAEGQTCVSPIGPSGSSGSVTYTLSSGAGSRSGAQLALTLSFRATFSFGGGSSDGGASQTFTGTR